MAECPGTMSDSSDEYYSLSSEEEGGGEGLSSNCEGMNGQTLFWPAHINLFWQRGNTIPHDWKEMVGNGTLMIIGFNETTSYILIDSAKTLNQTATPTAIYCQLA